MGTKTTARRRPRRAAMPISLALLAAVLPLVSPAAADPGPQAVAPGFGATVVLDGLTLPTNLEFAPDGRIFVAEKRGTVVAFDGLDDDTPTQVADLSGAIHDYEDRGLLGLEVDPVFPARPYLYVLYTLDRANSWGDACPNPPGTFDDGCVVDARLSRLTVDGDSHAVGPEHVLLEDMWCAQFPSHTIGDLDFAPDGALIVSGGDGADYNSVDYGQNGGDPDSPTPSNPCGDPPGGLGVALTPPDAEGGALRSQDLLTPGDPVTYDGTILRIDPDTGEAAPGNPLAGGPDPVDDRIIAHGVRNPFRLSSRPGTDEIWLGDVGWGSWEEVNRIEGATDATVENFGWPCYEGTGSQSTYSGIGLTLCTGLYEGTIPTALRPPHFQYQHGNPPDPARCGTQPGGSVTSIAFYDGGDYPAGYDGALFFGDYTRGCVWAMLPGADGVPAPGTIETMVTGAYPVDIEVGPGGDMFWVDILAGTVGRIGYFGADVPPVADIALDTDNGPLPLTVAFDGSASDPGIPGELTYAWDLDGDGDHDDSTSATPSFTYTAAGDITAGLEVTNAAGLTAGADIVIHAGNSRPMPTIGTPTAATTWSVDEEIGFAGGATDADDGALGAADLTWQVDLHHCSVPDDCHVHPLQTITGQASGSFLAPNHEHPSFLGLTLTATDATGLTGSTSLRLDPATVDLTFTTEPAGMLLSVGSRTAPTPFTQTVIAGSYHTVSAPSPQTAQGQSWTFDSWSDGGDQVHQILVDGAATYTAAFAAAGQPPTTVFVSDLPWVAESGGFGPTERDQANGDIAAGDGAPLSLRGQAFAKGIGAHADSAITVDVPAGCTTFDAVVGLDDEVGANGTATFSVTAGGQTLATTPVLTGTDDPYPVSIDITGQTQLTLSTDQAGDNNWWDHTDWADAHLTCQQ